MKSMRKNALLLLILSSCCFWAARGASISCQRDEECQETLLAGSECLNGFCTNPFHYGGCLESLQPGWTKKRVCSSDDPPEAIAKGYCRPSPWENEYMEVRLHGQVWESAWFNAWILQILLNEILGVPVSIEADGPGLSLDFYDVDSRIDSGNWQYFNQLVEGSKGDCRGKERVGENGEYEGCVHVVPEAWPSDIGDGIAGAEMPLRDLGSILQLRLFIPRFTMERDPSLLSYTGLGGEENRQKLAETFKRPTTWKHYCEEISQDLCATPDTVAARAPQNDEEQDRYHVEGLYTGYFRDTETHDCNMTANCTGDIVDFPCYGGSHTIQQIEQLGIKLRSHGDDAIGGYNHFFTPEIWEAANATKSDVMIMWWHPTPLYDRFLGTEAEMSKVHLPPPTQECENARAGGNRCELTYEDNIGSPLGACDYDSQFLKKVVTETFYELTHSRDKPEALWSPAYDAVVNFHVSHLDLGVMFRKQFEQTSGKGDFSPREAVCRWVVENMDIMESFIPPTYPRSLVEEDVSGDPLFVAAFIVACLAIVLSIAFAVGTHTRRNTEVMYYAQTEFLYLLLFGSLLVSVGALLLAIPPTDILCVSTAWVVNLGSALQFFSLFVRINAINKLAGSGKTMQRVHLKLQEHYIYVGFAVCFVSMLLLVWSVIDPPTMILEYELTTRTDADGDTIVDAYDSCGSEEDVWRYVNFGWQIVVLLLSAMVASMATMVKEDLNDTKTMSRMIYVHFIFTITRTFVVLSTTDKTKLSDLMGIESLLLSFGTITALLVYMLPKFTSSGDVIEEEPLPDLFLNTTVMVADIVGFSAWCSVREPVQVFKFLEHLYERFDKVADRYSVFKVETVREQYVAATGIPDAQADHAVKMARFASECMKKMHLLSTQLEVQYGPDTADLKLQIGLHSGPVTGGFMNRKGARFQLFGDTMTMSSMMHSSGEPGEIHMSAETVELLEEAGKKRWVVQREMKIHTTVKGELQTYWLRIGGHGNADSSESNNTSLRGSSEGDLELANAGDSEQRWVDFTVELLKNHLKMIIARNEATKGPSNGTAWHLPSPDLSTIPLEEVKEIIEMPTYDRRALKGLRDIDNVEIDEKVMSQLKGYVSYVSTMYNSNPFHNFAHASYVVMAIEKYLNRIKAASEIDIADDDRNINLRQAALHEHTYGITSDPLTQFACVFSALIHDIDHPGVPNGRLIEEDVRVASVYKERSVAEQKSFDMAWDLLMDSAYDDLRGAICRGPDEMKRFRQLVINSLMATDLGDKDLKDLRNRRWQIAFKEEASVVSEESNQEDRNRKATIVVEHLIQAADVAHTCQHWSIYRKWNERLFEECYLAYKSGRAEKDPAENWYEGEIGFFDFYIIPLSKKLRDCGVFGPTSDENLNYARNNRAMWERDGRDIVQEMLERLESVEEAPRESSLNA